MKHAIRDGITTCDNCKRIITSSVENKLLSAAWNVRNWYIEDIETLQKQCDLSDEELMLVKKYVLEDQLLHEEFVKIVREFVINK
jgi:hypothetical protein